MDATRSNIIIRLKVRKQKMMEEQLGRRKRLKALTMEIRQVDREMHETKREIKYFENMPVDDMNSIVQTIHEKQQAFAQSEWSWSPVSSTDSEPSDSSKSQGDSLVIPTRKRTETRHSEVRD